MLGLLRQWRHLALALFLAAPGLGGTLVSVAHPCPVDMPWLAGEHGGHEAQTSHGHGDTPSDSSESCNCVGACQGGSAAALIAVSANPTATLAAPRWSTSPSSPDRDSPAQPRLRRHPPSTAPPLA